MGILVSFIMGVLVALLINLMNDNDISYDTHTNVGWERNKNEEEE